MHDQDEVDHEEGSRFPPGTMLAHFKIERKLGEGAMGAVYLAEDTLLKRPVALKVIRAGYDMTATLLQEAKRQAKVDHEHICRVYESGQADSYVYIAMQYLKGPTLRDAMTQMNQKEKVLVCRDVARGLQAAHNAGLIHRDVKPGNVIVERIDGNWKPYLTDFGLARVIDDPRDTMAGVMKGSPFYMSPEQVEADDEIDARSDVYNLGATLYHVLSGETPHEGESTVEILVSVLEKEPVPISERSAHLPLDLRTITMKCLERDVSQRYQSARAFADDLDRYLNNQPVLATPPGAIYLLLKLMRRHKTAVTAFVLILTSLALAIVLASMAWVRANQAQRSLMHTERMAILEKDKAVAINDFLKNMIASPDPTREGRDVTIGEQLAQARDGLSRFDDRPETKVIVMATLSRLLMALGQSEEAREMSDEAYRLGTQKLTSTDPVLLSVLRLKAMLTAMSGRPQPAVNMAAEAETGYIRELGRLHQETLRARMVHGYALLAAGRGEDAGQLFERLQQDVRNNDIELDNELRTDIESLGGRITSARFLGRESENILRGILQTMELGYKDDHLKVAQIMENLVLSLRISHKFDEALDTSIRALELRRAHQSSDHPDLWRSRIIHAELLVLMTHYEKAFEEADQVLDQIEKGSENWQLEIRARHVRAYALFFLERYDEALEQAQINMSRCRSRLSPHDVNYVNALSLLAQTLAITGRHREAINYYQQAGKQAVAVFGATHRHTLVVQTRHAALLSKEGQLEEAEALFRDLDDQWQKAETDEPGVRTYWNAAYGQHLIRRGEYARADKTLQDGYGELINLSHVRSEIWFALLDSMIELYELTQDEDGRDYRQMRETIKQESLNGVYKSPYPI